VVHLVQVDHNGNPLQLSGAAAAPAPTPAAAVGGGSSVPALLLAVGDRLTNFKFMGRKKPNDRRIGETIWTFIELERKSVTQSAARVTWDGWVRKNEFTDTDNITIKSGIITKIHGLTIEMYTDAQLAAMESGNFIPDQLSQGDRDMRTVRGMTSRGVCGTPRLRIG